jgi:D-3-phosphoglycerate dehydrogenase
MKIVVTEPEPMSDNVRAALVGLGQVSWGPFSNDELASEVTDCDVLMVRLGRYIAEPLLARAPNLQYLVSATTALDHIDLAATSRAGVQVISLRDCPGAIRAVSSTAEHTLGLLLALYRRIPAAAAHVLCGGWDRNLFWGRQVRGKQIGILGYGRIGSMVGRYCATLGMQVIACDQDPALISPPATPLSFGELFESSDVISVHVTASPENRNLIDRTAIARMKPGAVLINTARGFIVDEAALAEAISSGHLGGAAVDVLQGEEEGNLGSGALVACARAGHNVLITPHIGGATREAIAQTEAAVIEVLAARLSARRR